MLCTCRVLLAALAVSCTLSRIHANGPSTQRLDRIKDLMCVLLLSGMQKDDLDASLLNKLQRHNVNMHDMNNKELLQECTTFQYSNNENITPQTNTMDTIYSLEKLTPKIRDVNINSNITKSNIKNSNDSAKYDHINKNYEDVIKYVDGQPELKSVLNFWKDIKVENSSKMTESTIKLTAAGDVVNKNYRPEQKNKRNVPDATNSYESDDLQKILVNFILKSRNKNINKPSNKKSIEIGDLYNNVYLLGTRNANKNTEINENDDTAGLAPVKMALLQATPVKQYDLMNNPGENNWQLKIPERDTERERQRTIKPNNFRNFNDILDRLQSKYPIKSRDKSVEHINENNKEIDNLYFKQFSERERSFTSTEKLIHPKIIEQKISQNIIKEIANTVKELILSDLRNEMFQTTTSYSTTEKQSTRTFITERDYVTPTVKMENLIEQTILSKFMDLFEEIKTLKYKTLIVSSENKKEDFKVLKNHNTYPEVIPIMNNNNGMLNTHSNYETILQYPKSNSQKIFNFSPQIHKFKINSDSESVIQVPNKRALPITVQTNNMEIPPLGIPVSNPENPISQNIIVATMRPYRIGDYDKMKSADSRISPNDYIAKKTESRILKALEPSHYDQNHQNDKRLTLVNDQSFIHDGVSLNRFKQSIHGGGVKRDSQPRFHEKLERARGDYNNPYQNEYTNNMVDCCDERYAFSKQMVDCCNRKVAARQQLSLSQVKKRPSYDDTHFNNFLKSQKKVTDMLERILASRGRVRSVETA